MIKVSAAITTLNNQSTLEKCLKSLSFCDEIIVLDSFSTDNTQAIAENHNVRWHQQKFEGYARQKQKAIDLCKNDWVLLLDSDEYFDTESITVLQKWQKSQPSVDAYLMPRREWVFWKWSHPWVHKNKFLRLFRKSVSKMSDHQVHESVQTQGQTEQINACIQHLGETSIQKKIGKINKYSSLAALQKHQSGKKASVLKIIFSPGFYFFKQYILRRQLFSGLAGLVNASLNTYYAFLKQVKLYELEKNKD